MRGRLLQRSKGQAVAMRKGWGLQPAWCGTRCRQRMVLGTAVCTTSKGACIHWRLRQEWRRNLAQGTASPWRERGCQVCISGHNESGAEQEIRRQTARPCCRFRLMRKLCLRTRNALASIKHVRVLQTQQRRQQMLLLLDTTHHTLLPSIQCPTLNPTALSLSMRAL